MEQPQAPLTFAIAGLTVACFVAAAWLRAGWIASAAGFMPFRVLHSVSAGPGLPFAVPLLLTPLSATLVHGSVMHLFFNMLMLVAVGRFVEDALGGWRFLLLYLTGAYAAAIAQFAASPDNVVPMIGASGAVSAIVGAQAVIYGQRLPRAWGPIPGRIVNMVWLAAAWTVLQVLTNKAVGPGIAVPAHLGGFVAGLLLAEHLERSRAAAT